MALVFCQKKIV